MAYVPPQFQKPQGQAPPPGTSGFLAQTLKAMQAAQQQKQQQQQQATNAASLLAQKSHNPQTLAKNNPQQQAGAKNPLAPPPPPSLASMIQQKTQPKPPAVNPAGQPQQAQKTTAAAQPAPVDPMKLLQDQLAQSQKALPGLQNQQTQTYGALQQALGAPMPDAPTYQAPEQPKPDLGMALGAALAGLFARHAGGGAVAQGAMNGLGVSQQNAKDKYANDVATAQQNYKVAEDAYTNQVANRQDNIGNQEKLNNAADARVKNEETNETRLSGDLDLADHRKKEEAERQAGIDEKARHDRDIERRGWANTGIRNRALDNTIDHQAKMLNFDTTKFLTSTKMQQQRLAQQLTIAGLNSETAVDIANTRVQAEAVLRQSSEWQQNNRQLVNAAMQFRNSTTALYGNLYAHDPAAAKRAADGLVGMMNGNSGKALKALLNQAGPAGDLVNQELLETEGEEESASPATDANGNASKEVKIDVNLPQAAAPTVDPIGNLPQAHSAYGADWASKHGIPAGLVGGSGHAGNPPGNNSGPQLDKAILQGATGAYQDSVKHGYSPKESWLHVASQLRQAGVKPQEMEWYRRSIMNQGKA